MTTYTTDRRIRRSKRLLGDALLSLLQHYDLNQIKVRQVTEKADVGYMTFYRHYNNLDELLVDRVQSFIEEEINQVVPACDQQAPIIFQHLQAHVSLYQTILFSPAAAHAKRMMEALLAQSFMPTIADDALIPIELRAYVMASTAMSLIQWWLEQALKPPIDHMVQLYNKLVIERNLDSAKMQAFLAQRSAAL